MSNNNKNQNLKNILEKLPEVIFVNEIIIENEIIKKIIIEKKQLGKLIIKSLVSEDAPALFNFYFHGLSEKSKLAFDPYPLFQPFVNSSDELANRIIDWKKEDDWVALKIVKDNEIIGLCLLKKYKREKPVFGFAVREKFQGMGLGTIMLTIINEQAQLLKLEKLWSGTQKDNIASLTVHKNCGFKLTGVLNPHFIYKDGNKLIDRHDVEMVKEFFYK